MHLVVLIIHFLLCAALIGLILIQRSEGGGLGMGGGPGGLMSGRSAANLLTRTTSALAAGFFVTSVLLTIIVARGGEGSSVLDRINSPTELSTFELDELDAPAAAEDEAPAAPQPVIPDQE